MATEGFMRLSPSSHCVAAAHESMKHKISAPQQINIWPPPTFQPGPEQPEMQPTAMHLYFMEPLNLYSHLTSDYNNSNHMNYSNNSNSNNDKFALCGQSLFGLFFGYKSNPKAH